MTFDYGPIRKSASDLIARFGFQAVLVRSGGASGPEYAPVFGATQRVPITIVGVSFSQSDRQSGFVQDGDAKYALADQGLPFAPTSSDWLEIDSAEWAIQRVETLAPGGQAVRYLLHVRQQ